ncbi:MAG: fumarylacetoacetate hydrolase family protein [Nocardioidaceae bacterium]
MLPRSKVLGIGRNYADHAAEMGNEVPAEPLVFLKPNTSVIGPGDPIVVPASRAPDVHFEGELAVVIGRICRDVPRGRRSTGDLRLHRRQRRHRARPAAAATASGRGPRASTRSARWGRGSRPTSTPRDAAITTTLGGETKQDGRTSDMLVDVPDLVAYVSSFMTLLPGDVILTGTPDGVGPMLRR